MSEIYNLLVHEINQENKDYLNLQKVEFETQNNPAEVSFNYKKVFEYEDSDKYNVVGFFHTHPSGMKEMSSLDMQTMLVWSKCLGRPLLCCIESSDEELKKATGFYILKAWWISIKDECIETECYYSSKKENEIIIPLKDYSYDEQE